MNAIKEEIIRNYLRPVFARGIEAHRLDVDFGTDDFFFEVATQICQLFTSQKGETLAVITKHEKRPDCILEADTPKPDEIPLARICNEDRTSGVATGANKPAFNPDWKPDIQAILQEHQEAIDKDKDECDKQLRALASHDNAIIESNKSLYEARFAREEAELIRFIDSKMLLEQCDTQTMAYFNDYYWIDKKEWQDFKKEKGIK